MSENDGEYFYNPDEPDLEQPEDGRDGQPPEEGSSDNPESLAAHDPLHSAHTVLSDTDSLPTVADPDAEPADEDDWAVEAQRVFDEKEFEEEYPEDAE